MTTNEPMGLASADWWQGFFDADYLRLWSELAPEAHTAKEADGIWRLLDLREGARVLDAPCGYGRVALALCQRGAVVQGVDYSATLLAEAERRRGDCPLERLSFLRHDLRQPLPPPLEGAFDGAVNVFTSLGYGTEADDLAILTTLARAVRPGGRVLVETMHRDPVAAFIARGMQPGRRYPDGTLLVEDPHFDPVAGRMETTWYWSGPQGGGAKRASLRIYAITELVRLMERAGLVLEGAFSGCSPAPFRASGPEVGGRVGLVARRP
jgi:SAM-dependent methyltransferase